MPSPPRDRSPAFQCYPRDWDTDLNVIPMTYEEEGVYFALIRLAWLHGGLPADLDRLRRLLKGQPSHKKMTTLWVRIAPCWRERDGKLYHPRLERERDKQEAWRAEQSVKGQRAAKARWDASRMPDASTAHTPCTLDAMPGDASSSASSSSSASAEEPRERTLSLVASPRPADAEPSQGQLRAGAPALVEAWNRLVASRKPFVAVTVHSHSNITTALRGRPDLDWWGDVFAKVAASDFLAGRIALADGRPWVADFWWVLDRAEQIHSGRYDNRQEAPATLPASRAQQRRAKNAASVAAVIASYETEPA